MALSGDPQMIQSVLLQADDFRSSHTTESASSSAALIIVLYSLVFSPLALLRRVVCVGHFGKSLLGFLMFQDHYSCADIHYSGTSARVMCLYKS